MVKYQALTRFGPGRRSGRVGCPGGALGTFRSFRNNSRNSAFLKSMRTFRNVAFSKLCTVVWNVVFIIFNNMRKEVFWYLYRVIFCGNISRKIGKAWSMSVLVRSSKLKQLLPPLEKEVQMRLEEEGARALKRRLRSIVTGPPHLKHKWNTNETRDGSQDLVTFNTFKAKHR